MALQPVRGGFGTSLCTEARKLFFEIRLWDADDIIGALAEIYGQFPDDLQAVLPPKRMWTLVLEE